MGGQNGLLENQCDFCRTGHHRKGKAQYLVLALRGGCRQYFQKHLEALASQC